MLLTKDFIKLVLFANIVAWPVVWLTMKAWQNTFAYSAGLKIELFVLGSVITCGIAVITISYQAVKVALSNPVDSLRYE